MSVEYLVPGSTVQVSYNVFKLRNVSGQLQFRKELAWLNWARVFLRKNSIPRVPLSMQTSALAFLPWHLYISQVIL